MLGYAAVGFQLLDAPCQFDETVRSSLEIEQRRRQRVKCQNSIVTRYLYIIHEIGDDEVML
jgi:hypothetical protein